MKTGHFSRLTVFCALVGLVAGLAWRPALADAQSPDQSATANADR